jgi:hypothetical protein
VLGAGLSCGTLSLGLWTAWVAADNHAVARDLDERNRACDALAVWNESLSLDVLAAEERVLAAVESAADGTGDAEEATP